jgi:hypothetical protein
LGEQESGILKTTFDPNSRPSLSLFVSYQNGIETLNSICLYYKDPTVSVQCLSLHYTINSSAASIYIITGQFEDSHVGIEGADASGSLLIKIIIVIFVQKIYLFTK